VAADPNWPDMDAIDPEQQRWIAGLESEWSEPNGFLCRVRQGSFVSSHAESLLKILEEMGTPGDRAIERRLISLVWYLPIFLTWQSERILEWGGDPAAYERLVNRVQDLVERILGVP
jgi:hypothetical protein